MIARKGVAFLRRVYLRLCVAVDVPVKWTLVLRAIFFTPCARALSPWAVA